MLDLFTDNEEESDDSVVNRDMLYNVVAIFAMIIMILIPVINVNKKTTTEEQLTNSVRGNITVETRWDDGTDDDVDLWVKAPGDVPVGYSNKGGAVFNLVRDDLGKSSDITNLNYEISFSRGIPVGEYTVNLHGYRLYSTGPVNVVVWVTVRKGDGGDKTGSQILKRTVILKHGAEVTVFNFKLDNLGNMVPGSMNEIFKPLRAAAK